MTDEKYLHFDALPQLVEQKLITRRPHPVLPIDVYNYTVTAQFMPPKEWTEPLKDCRGLILDREGYIVARPFRKFWNYSQMLDQIPAADPFTVWEKLDGSLGIVATYAGERVYATRGSFESDQAKWLAAWFEKHYPDFYPSGETWLFEIIYPDNRIVVDYRGRQDVVLLSVMAPDAVDLWPMFENCDRFPKARRFDGVTDFGVIDGDPQFAGQEGFVVQWPTLRAKVKLAEYTRLHKLITTCSTRTIWELLRAGNGLGELLDRVPDDFKAWVTQTGHELKCQYARVNANASADYQSRPPCDTRKDFALWAKQQSNASLLFSLLDGRDITDACWKLVEPKWATPFRKDIDA